MRSGLLTVLSVSVFLASCGGGGGGADPTPAPPPPPPPQSTASFTAANTGTAQAPLAFDASASTSSDGSALTYRWNFGDGQLGNGAKIAHAFGAAGSFSVTLTVTDGASRSATASKTVAVTAAAAPGPTIPVTGVVQGVDGLAIDGVTATAPDGATATSNAMGKVTLSLGTDVPMLVRLAKAGYADQFVSVSMPHTAGADAGFSAVMRPRSASQAFDATAGGSLTTPDGASLTLPANGVVDGAGAIVSGSIDVTMTPVDVTLPGGGGFPGSYDGVNTDASTTPIVSFGTTEFVLGKNGQRLQVAPGKTATIELPLAASQRVDGTAVIVGDSIPLWSLDEKTGLWINEGSGLVVASANAPNGLALRAQVAHLSWWNADLPFSPYAPRPDCRADTAIGLPQGAPAFATATFCNFLAEFERDDDTSGKTGVSKVVTAAASAKMPGYSRRMVVAIPGGPGNPFPVPADSNIVLSASALNGTWTGRQVIRGPVGQIDTITLLMRPVAASGTEDITLPFDATRTLGTGQTARFDFTGTATKFVSLQVAPSESSLTGTVKLLRDGAVLASAGFGPGTASLAVPLPDGGPYTIEVASTADATGAYHVTASLAGGAQDEALGVPFDVTRPLAEFTTQRIGFDVTGPTGLYLNLQRTGAAQVTLRLRDSGGAVVGTMSTTPGIAPTSTVTLATGHYVAEVSATNGAASAFRVSAESTSFVPAAASLAMAQFSNIIDLQADRNGAPVVAYQRSIDDGGNLRRTVILQRLNGGAWSQVGTDSPTIQRPCSAYGEAISFDSSNRPVVAYVERDVAGQGTSTRVVRFDGNAWIAVGANDGILPSADATGIGCQRPPVVRVSPAGVIAIAYPVDEGVTVQKFDGTNWVGFATNAGDAFASTFNTADLRFDSTGRPIVAYTIGQSVAVRRLSASAPFTWQQLGADSTVPLGTLNNLGMPRLRIDASDQPILAAYAGVPTGEFTFTGGLAVYRLEGGDWHGVGGYRPMDTGIVGTTFLPGPAVTFANGEALLAFSYAATGVSGRTLVQRNTAAGFSPVGANLGEVPQLFPHGLTTGGATGPSLLESSGADTWLAVLAKPDGALNTPVELQLYKLVR